MKTQLGLATWPGRCVDMRLKGNKELLKIGIRSGHARRICVACNSFSGARMAWEFSNELIAATKEVQS